MALQLTLLLLIKELSNEKAADTLLFGRKAHELMEAFLVRSKALELDPFVAGKMNDLPKNVFSHSLHTVSWENTRLIRDNIKEEVRRLKQLSCKKILMLACYDLTLTFMDLNPIEKTKHSLQE
jgi:hypothetical protein